MAQGFFPNVTYVPPPPSPSRPAASASSAASATPTAPAPKVAGNGNGNGKGGAGSSGGTVNLTANALAAVNSTPASTSTSTRPDSSQSFDFALPSFPPRLSKVGRRISELSTQFLNELDLPDEPSSAGGGGGGGGSKRVSSEKPREEVPGMGDEPVMCPFCEKPLPPALFERMTHQQNHRRPGPPSRSATATSARGFGGGWNEAAARAAVGASSPSVSVSRSSSLPPGASASLSTSAPPSASPLAMAGGTGMAMSQSAIPASTPKLLDPLPVSSPRPNTQPATIPASTSAQGAAPAAAAAAAASASSLLSTVQQAETAETFASSSTITPDDLARWSTLAGIPLAPAPQPTTATTSSTTSTSGPGPVLEKARAIPAIPPPPPAAERFQPPARTSSAGSGRFGFFRRGSRPKEDDDESEDEDHASGAGYAKLTAPGSPDLESDDEVDGFVKQKSKAKDAATTATPAEQEPAGEPAGKTAEETEPVKEERPTDGNVAVSKPGDEGVKVDGEQPPDQSQSDAELRKVLQEVLSKVNAMSKSHSDLVSSHTGLLTSLKIARSNLAMAEANTEMLEAQLKQRGPSSTLPGAVSTSPVVAKAQAVVAAGGTPSGAVVPRPPVTPGTSKSVTSGGVPVAGAPTPGIGVSYAVRQSPERARPPSLQIPRTDLSNAGPATGPAASTSETKGWGFWQGGKKKLPGGLGSLTIPSPAQIASALDSTTRPTTPTSEKRSLDFARSPVAPFSSALPDIHSMPRSPGGGGGGGLHRSSSSVNLPATSAPASVTARSAAAEAELSRLHAAYKVTVSKMDGMAKELAELKKGKVEMEAELESLSQALFEEANKMVADERRKRAEVEEALKEVKEEREALRQTIKVLGGRVDDQAEGAGAEVDEKGGDGAKAKKSKEEEDKGVKTPEEFDEEMFVPRDLDKHYAALRKTIHHVSDGATGGTEVTSTSPLDAFAAAIGANTGNAGASGDDDEGSILIVGPGSTTVPTEPGATPPKLRAISAPTSPNPWAEAPAIAPAIEMQAPTPSPRAPTTEVGGVGGGASLLGQGEVSGGLGLAVGEEVGGTGPGTGLEGKEARQEGGALELELERGKGFGEETGLGKGPEPPMSPVDELDKLMDKLREDMD